MEGDYIKTQLDDFLAFPARLFGFTDRQHSSLYNIGHENRGMGQWDMKRERSEVDWFIDLQTVRIASSNTVFNPFCVRAEHSRYYSSASLPVVTCVRRIA